MQLSEKGRHGSRLHDTIDLGFIRLTEQEVEAAGRGNFIDVVERQVPTGMRWQIRYVALGHPEKDQRRDDVHGTYAMAQTYLMTEELSESKYRLAGLDRRVHIGLLFDRSRLAGPRGRGGKPNLVGMSGCGVWELDPYITYGPENPPALIGFLAATSRRINWRRS